MADKATPGQSLFRSPIANARNQNNILEATAYYQERVKGGKGGGPDKHQLDHTRAKVKNVTGSDLRRGEVVELGTFLLDDLDPSVLWFRGETPNLTRTTWGVMLYPTPNNEIADCQLVGTCLAWVNISNVNHQYARPKAGTSVLQSSSIGPVKILYKPPGQTGEQECAVSIECQRPRTALASVTNLAACDLTEATLITGDVDMSYMPSTLGSIYVPDAADKRKFVGIGQGHVYNPTPFLLTGTMLVNDMNGCWVVDRPVGYRPTAVFAGTTADGSGNINNWGLLSGFGGLATASGDKITITAPARPESLWRITWYCETFYTWDNPCTQWDANAFVSLEDAGGHGFPGSGSFEDQVSVGRANTYITGGTQFQSGGVNVEVRYIGSGSEGGIKTSLRGQGYAGLTKDCTISMLRYMSTYNYGSGTGVYPGACQARLILEPMF